MYALHVWAGCGFLKQSGYHFTQTLPFCIWFIDAYPIFRTLRPFELLLLNYTPRMQKGEPAVIAEH